MKDVFVKKHGDGNVVVINSLVVYSEFTSNNLIEKQIFSVRLFSTFFSIQCLVVSFKL